MKALRDERGLRSQMEDIMQEMKVLELGVMEMEDGWVARSLGTPRRLEMRMMLLEVGEMMRALEKPRGFMIQRDMEGGLGLGLLTEELKEVLPTIFKSRQKMVLGIWYEEMLGGGGFGEELQNWMEYTREEWTAEIEWWEINEIMDMIRWMELCRTLNRDKTTQRD